MEESFFGNEIDTTGLDDLGDVDCSGGVYRYSFKHMRVDKNTRNVVGSVCKYAMPA